MELLLGFVLIAVSTALGLLEAARLSGPNRGSPRTIEKPTFRQRQPALFWRMLQIALLVSGVGILQREFDAWAYLIFGIVLVLPLIFGLWRNRRRPAEA